MSFNHSHYQISQLSLDLYQNEELIKENIPTEYEKRFVSNGSKIYYIEVEKE